MDFQSAAFPLALNDLLQWRWRISTQQCHLLAEFRWEREFAEYSSKKALFLWKQKLQQPHNKSWGGFLFPHTQCWIVIVQRTEIKQAKRTHSTGLEEQAHLSGWIHPEWVHKCVVHRVYIQMLTKLSMKDEILQVHPSYGSIPLVGQ